MQLTLAALVLLARAMPSLAQSSVESDGVMTIQTSMPSGVTAPDATVLPTETESGITVTEDAGTTGIMTALTSSTTEGIMSIPGGETPLNGTSGVLPTTVTDATTVLEPSATTTETETETGTETPDETSDETSATTSPAETDSAAPGQAVPTALPLIAPVVSVLATMFGFAWMLL